MAQQEPPYALIIAPKLPSNFERNHIESFHIEMCLIHNVFIRALNSLHINSSIVKPQDQQAFAGYALTFITAIEQHHHGEETIIFPFLQKKVDMSHNVEQHENFQNGLKAFKDYMTAVKKGSESYDPQKMKSLLEGFAGPLIQHLHEEIPTISPAQLETFDKKDFDMMVKSHAEHIKNTGEMFTTMPFVASHHDQRAVPEWPPFPAPLKFIARNLSRYRYPGYWQFSPFTTKGKPNKYGS